MAPAELSRSEALIAFAKDFLGAGNAQDVDAALSFYAEDATLRSGPPPFTDVAVGTQQLRSMLVGVLPGYHVEESWNFRTSVNTVSWVSRWSSDYFRNMGVDHVVGTIELVLEGDKVKLHTVTFSPETIEKLSPETIEKLWRALE